MRIVNSVYFKVLALCALLFVLYKESFENADKDFTVFVGAAKLVLEGSSCYEVWIHVGKEGLKYFYSPLFAVLLFPFTYLPQEPGNAIWLALNLGVIYRLFVLFTHYLPLQKTSLKAQVFYLLVLLAGARFMFDCFSLGQMTFILAWGSLESFRLFTEKKHLTGAAILALIINVKIIPIALLAYLVYKKEIRAAAYTVMFFVLFLFLPALVIGPSFNAQLIAEWFASLTGTNAESIHGDYGRQSLSAFFPALLMNTPVQFGIPRNVVNLSPENVTLALNIARLLLLVLAVRLFGRPFCGLPNRIQLFYELAFVCALTPLFFPHQGKYSFVYQLPACAFVVYTLARLSRVKHRAAFKRTYNRALWLFVGSFTFCTLTTDGLIGRTASNLCEYLQCITIGSLLLLVLLVLLAPGQKRASSPIKF